jgi:hypothetical protein
VPGPNKTSDEWSGEAKFAVVVETAVLSSSLVRGVEWTVAVPIQF